MTKKFLLTIAAFYVLLYLTNPCAGQTINIGLKAGVGLSELYQSKGWEVSSMPDNRLLINVTGGITFNFQINERWSIHSEILYQDKGQKSVSLSDSEWVKGMYRRNVQDIYLMHNYFLDFPQTIRFHIPLSAKSPCIFYVEAGPYFAYYLTTRYIQKTKYDGTELTDIGYDDLALGERSSDFGFNRFNWGLKVGTGLLLNLKKGTFDFNIADEQMLESFPYDKSFNIKSLYNVLSITVGYSLPVGKIGRR
jgi:hypothetical protein